MQLDADYGKHSGLSGMSNGTEWLGRFICILICYDVS